MSSKSILIVAATVPEIDFVIDQYGESRLSPWKEESAYLLRSDLSANLHFIVTGIGPKSAEVGLEAAMERFESVAILIGCGFSGGIVKTSVPGDLVIPTEVLWDQNPILTTDWLRMQVGSQVDLKGNVWRQLMTVTEMVDSPAKKAAMHAATGFEAVDMESAVWGEVAQRKGVPWGIVRSILDGPQESFHPGWTKTVDQYGRPLIRRVLGFLLSNPSETSAIKKLRPKVLKAKATYSQVIGNFLQSEIVRRSDRDQSHQPNVKSEVA